jgi:hypothetical protein
MARPSLLASLALVLTAAFSLADNPKSEPREAEVRFADGSAVRVLVLQETLEVATKYGKLVVPTTEVRRIEFGQHLPEATVRRVDALIKQLGSDNFHLREQATSELAALGPDAFLRLKLAARSNDLEVAQRAQAVIERIRENHPAEKLQIKYDDSITTAEFPVVGRIVSATIKVRTSYFGDLELKVPELRSIRWTAGGGEEEITVDAAKYGSARDQWMDTGFVVNSDVGLLVTAAGQVDLWPQGPGQYVTGPAGYRNTAGQVNSFPSGALLGRIGEHGKIFLVGQRYEETPTQDGKLYLHIVPSPWNNASAGSYKVRITTVRK